MTRNRNRPNWHYPTAIAVAAFAWMLLMTGHEVVGHGGACVGLGGEALAVDAMYFTCSELTPLWNDQLYRAAGSLFNVLLAIGCVIAFLRLPRPGSWTGYFLWISAVLNLLQSGSYVALGRFIHPGMDWAMIAANAPDAAVAGTLTLVCGLGLLAAGVLVGQRFLGLFIARGARVHRQKIRLVLTPYLTATFVSVAASLGVPSEDRFMMLMGGIGNSLFFLAPILLLLVLPVRGQGLVESEPDFAPRRGLVVAATATTLVYLFVIASGVELG